jgi:hypothetical protein
MNTYKIIFTGRTKGALGITYSIEEEVQANNPEEARLKLYDRYEHIMMTACFNMDEEEE